MAEITLTQEQAAQLVEGVQKIVADKKTADDATAASNATAAALTQAQSDDSNAKLVEATADHQVTLDVQAHLAFVQSLVG